MLIDQALYYVTIAAWIIAAGFVLILFIRTWQGDGFVRAFRRIFSERMLFGLVIFATLLTLLVNSLVFIQPQEVGVVVNLIAPRGYNEQPLYSGINWITPFVARVYRYPIAWQTYTMSSTPGEGQRPGDDSVSARTSDGQEVFIDLSLIYAIDPAQAVRVHIGWQDRYPEELIRPLLRSTIRSVVSKFTVQEVNSSQRTVLEGNINTQLSTALNRNGFMLQQFLLREIDFTSSYAQAVENKQSAEEGVATSRYEAEQTRLRAAGEADALQTLGDALRSNPEVITLRYIDKIVPNISVMLLPSNAPFIFPFPNGVLTPTLGLPTVTPPPAVPTPAVTTTP